MGYFLLAGGAEFPERASGLCGGRMSEPDLRAIELAGGFDAPICFIPTAAAPDNNHKRAGNNGIRWFQSLGAKQVLAAVRSHWDIENSLHWTLDMAFDEDHCRVCKDNALENFAILRHIVLNLLKQEKTSKRSINGKRLLTGWMEDYLLKVLSGLSHPSI